MTNNSIVSYLKKCLYFAPFPVLSLLIYMSLRSSSIFSRELGWGENEWHLAYLGWYDFLLLWSILISLFIGVFRISKDLYLFLGITFFMILLTSALNGMPLGIQPFFDSIIYLLRFFLVFCFVIGLVQRLDVREVEGVLITLFWILAISSLFVLKLQYGIHSRMYSSGMTVASFSQVAAITVMIALMRKYKFNLLVASGFLFFTFSRTSIFLTLILVICYFLFVKKIVLTKKTQLLLIIGIVISFGVIYSLRSEEYYKLIFRMADADEISSLNRRTDIWEYALKLLKSGVIPVYGIGFNMTPTLTNEFDILKSSGIVFYPPSFHSIIIEYGFGLGVLSIFIFYLIIKRIWQTFRYRCFPAFFIFFFFFACQNVDFTFYRPKEVIVWSIMLGLAEGQWRKMQTDKSEELLKMQDSANSTIK